MKAADLRKRIVERMEANNEQCEALPYWRLSADGIAEKGYEVADPWPSKWEAVHPLSPYLLAQARENRERLAQGIWF